VAGARPQPLRVTRIGERARRSLERSGGLAMPHPAFPDAPYFDAEGEIVWIGAKLPAMHPRAVVTDAPAPRGAPLRLLSVPASGWSARLPGLEPHRVAAVRRAAAALHARLARVESPRGFAARLAGRVPEFPLALAAGRADALAAAYANDDANAVVEASVALLGLGTGFTPSGDDLAGGALFGRRLVAPSDARWPEAAERLVREAARRTNAVSAALFADLARGASFEPLHALAHALAAGDAAAALGAARALVAIGHSSGWDMLAGFFAGLGRR
jgi:hypothetical protein